MDSDQVLLQHPFVPDLRPANGTAMLRILPALLSRVPDQRLHPPILLPTIRAEMPPKPLVIVWAEVN